MAKQITITLDSFFKSGSPRTARVEIAAPEAAALRAAVAEPDVFGLSKDEVKQVTGWLTKGWVRGSAVEDYLLIVDMVAHS